MKIFFNSEKIKFDDQKNNGVADQINTFAVQNNNSADHFTNSQC
jgi:hypothetical protein